MSSLYFCLLPNVPHKSDCPCYVSRLQAGLLRKGKVTMLYFHYSLSAPKLQSQQAKENNIFDMTELHDRALWNLFPTHPVFVSTGTLPSVGKVH